VRREVVWSAAAAGDLSGLAAALGEKPAARRVTEAIWAAADGLAQTPSGRPGRVTGTYEKPVPGLPYIVAYTLGALPRAGEAVIILGIVGGAQAGAR
jgi:plasmid stabilization system protein ParE